MKQIYLATCLLFLWLTSSSNVFRINNTKATSEQQKIFNTVQEAHDFSGTKAGDTLMIEGSSLPYAEVVLNKPLVLIGPGYFLTQNPQTQSNTLDARMRRITLNPLAAGTILEGLSFAVGSSAYTPAVAANNAIIRKCLLSSAIHLSDRSSGLQVIGCYFESNALGISTTAYTATNIAFKNNIVIGHLNVAATPSWQNNFSVVEHNVIGGSVEVTASIFRSNILMNGLATFKINSNNIQNNLLAGTQFTGNGNQTYGLKQIFGSPAGRSADGMYSLAAGSEYIAAGYDGSQPGVFGGTTGYVLSGIPPIPVIYEFLADGSANKEAGLLVTIKAKAN
ncbi:MAG: hypothetical protein EOO04_29355 [Chitinophagaceae bacterium]|nr:MAG: hypothetical protein EOO04_29355 [Chitinophagaceae bacterium]